MAGVSEFQQSACAGKVTFTTYAKASKVAMRDNRISVPRHAYHCKFCGQYHIGEAQFDNNRSSGKERKRRLLELEEREAWERD